MYMENMFVLQLLARKIGVILSVMSISCIKSTEAGLLYNDQWVLANKVFSIESKIILKRLGTMYNKDYEIVESMFNEIF